MDLQASVDSHDAALTFRESSRDFAKRFGIWEARS